MNKTGFATNSHKWSVREEMKWSTLGSWGQGSRSCNAKVRL